MSDLSIKRCRICLQSNETLYSLQLTSVAVPNSSQVKAELICLGDIYEQFTQLSYNESGIDWESICIDCHDKLIEFHQFRLLCIESSHKLIEITTSYVDDPISSVKDEQDDSDNDHTFDDIVDEYNGSDDSLHTEATVQAIPHEPIASVQHPPTGDRQTFKCVTCSRQLMDEQHYEAHMRKHLGLKPWQCQQCDQGFTKFLTLKAHIARKHDQSTLPEYICDKCGKKYTHKESIKAHILTVHMGKKRIKPARPVDDDSHVCGICSRKCGDEHLLEAHMRRHQGLLPWHCTQCDKSFVKRRTLKSHMMFKHPDETTVLPEFICDNCGNKYAHKESLRIHMLKIHLGRKPKIWSKICEECGKVCRSNHALRIHAYTHTRVSDFKCPRENCGKMFSTKDKLKDHLNRHDGVKRFVCPQCGLRKVTMHELRTHIKHHEDIKYTCELCGVEFTRQPNLKRHMKVVHQGIRKYACEHCGKTFGKAETLKYHVMTHTGERPLECEYCHKRFIQPVALKKHILTHTKNFK